MARGDWDPRGLTEAQGESWGGCLAVVKSGQWRVAPGQIGLPARPAAVRLPAVCQGPPSLPVSWQKPPGPGVSGQPGKSPGRGDSGQRDTYSEHEEAGIALGCVGVDFDGPGRSELLQAREVLCGSGCTLCKRGTWLSPEGGPWLVVSSQRHS